VYSRENHSDVSLLSIFATAILPIVAIAAAGFLLGKTRDVDAGSLNTVTVYVLVPALVFHTLTTTELGGGTLASIALGVFLFTGVMAVLAQGTGAVLGNAEPILGTFVLVSVFSNAGNLGIPVSEFAFGPLGRSTAVVFIAAQSIAMYTLGVYLAARGDDSHWREGMRAVFAIPLVYTVVAALLARSTGVVPPADTAVMETLKLVGDSAIPVMLLILGIELAETDYGAAALQVTPAVGLKLLVAPLVAVGIVTVVGFQNQTVARVFVLECAMPAAVTTLILTGEFAGDATGDLAATEYASTAIFVSTVISVPLLTGLIALLQSGAIL
jgi:predicted permease